MKILLLLLLSFVLAQSIVDVKDINKLKDKEISSGDRINFYMETIIWGWVPLLVTGIISCFTDITANDIGFRKIAIQGNKWVNSITFLFWAILLILLVYQVFSYLLSEKYRQEIKNQIESNDTQNHYDIVMNNIMIPRNKKEKTLFFLVSLTAGISEETLIRGVLIFLLQAVFPSFHVVVIVLLASLVFGTMHLYQGVYGLIKTILIGGMFCSLYLITDSLYPGIILHFLVDFSSVFILKEETV